MHTQELKLVPPSVISIPTAPQASVAATRKPAKLRMLVATWLASAQPPSHLAHARHAVSPVMFRRKPEVAREEYNALSGVWMVDLQLEEEADTSLSVHLATPQGSTDFPHSGRASIMEGPSLPLACLDPDQQNGWWAAKRRVHAGTEGDDIVYLAVQLGDSMLLDGQGQRGGLRCRNFGGKVWDVGAVANGDRARGSLPPRRKWRLSGHFTMRLALPIKTDTAVLESQYEKRMQLRRERETNFYVPPSQRETGSAVPSDAGREETLREKVERTAAALRLAEAEVEAAFAEVRAGHAKVEAGEARAKAAQENAGAARQEARAAQAELAEEEGKRAWLEKLNATPIWAQHQQRSLSGEDDPEEETRDSAPYASS